MNDGKIGIFVIERQELLREGLLALLVKEDNVVVLGASDCERDALNQVRLLQVDVVLLDSSFVYEMGTNIVRDLAQIHPQSKVIALANQSVEMCVRSTLALGVAGYLLKQDSRAELMLAIQSVMQGKTYLSPSIFKFVVSAYLGQRMIESERRTLDRRGRQPDRRSGDTGSAAADALTYRERQIIKLIAEGYKNKEIARTLAISPKTVEKHRANLMKKLDCHSTSRLTVFAMENGLLPVGFSTQAVAHA